MNEEHATHQDFGFQRSVIFDTPSFVPEKVQCTCTLGQGAWKDHRDLHNRLLIEMVQET